MSLPKQCCVSGSLHTGTPTGTVSKLHGFDVYIASPPSEPPKGIVVILPDIFGWTLPNTRILADNFAAKGNFLVMLPDFMDGNEFPKDLIISLDALDATGLFAWVTKAYHLVQIIWRGWPFFKNDKAHLVRPRVRKFFRALQHSHPELPVAAAGYCWGGQWVVELCTKPDDDSPEEVKPFVVCGFTAHPSRLKIPTDIEAVTYPLSIAAAGIDQQIPVAKAKQIEDILKAKTAKTKDRGVEHEFVLYEDTHHGFAVRADEKEGHERECGKKAEEQAIRWFTKWFERAGENVNVSG
ncbi:dienelactone hydrolase family protein, partial [Aureobasidium melanogenum]